MNKVLDFGFWQEAIAAVILFLYIFISTIYIVTVSMYLLFKYFLSFKTVFCIINTDNLPINPVLRKFTLLLLLLLLLLLWLYSTLLGLVSFFSFLILYTVGWTHWMGDHAVQRPPPTHRINTEYRHPCTEWDSNPWSQRLSGRRRFIP
jgi:hypothetical protein